MENLSKIKEICEEVQEKFANEMPYTYNLARDILQENLESYIKSNNELLQTSEDEIKGILLDYYTNEMLVFVFSLYGKKRLDKTIDLFLKNTVLDPRVYNFLMEHMPEFREFNASLNEQTQKRFSNARRREKAANIICAIRSLGISNLIGRQSEKSLRELANNPFVRDTFKILTISGVLNQ